EASRSTPTVNMEGTSWAFSEDLPTWAVITVAALVVGAIALLLLELRRSGARVLPILVTGILGVSSLGLAVLRPVRVTTEGLRAAAPATVVGDQSRRLRLRGGEGTRWDRARQALERLPRGLEEARREVLGVADGEPVPARPAGEGAERRATSTHSGLVAAL